MFIDTQTAQRTMGPNLQVTGPNGYTAADESPLLETFVGQDAPPPSYLEATTPLPWAGRPGGDEGARLLEDGGRAPISPMSEEYKDGKYRKRGFLDWFTTRRVVTGLLIVVGIILVGAIFAALAGIQGNKVCVFLTCYVLVEEKNKKLTCDSLLGSDVYCDSRAACHLQYPHLSPKHQRQAVVSDPLALTLRKEQL